MEISIDLKLKDPILCWRISLHLTDGNFHQIQNRTVHLVTDGLVDIWTIEIPQLVFRALAEISRLDPSQQDDPNLAGASSTMSTDVPILGHIL